MIADIAERQLTTQVSERIHRVLGDQTLVHIANYPDEIRWKKNSHHNWHYMNANKESDIDTKNIHNPQNIIDALEFEYDALSQAIRENDTEKQRKIIPWLVHLVGDLHQPFHIGSPADRGGTACKVRWYQSRFPTSIHHIWDKELVESQHLGFHEYAKWLDHKVKHHPEWIEGTFQSWGKESFRLYQTLYPQQKHIKRSDYCSSHTKRAKKIPSIHHKYVQKKRPIMEDCLVKSGVRLGVLLNQLYS